MLSPYLIFSLKCARNHASYNLSCETREMGRRTSRARSHIYIYKVYLGKSRVPRLLLYWYLNDSPNKGLTASRPSQGGPEYVLPSTVAEGMKTGHENLLIMPPPIVFCDLLVLCRRRCSTSAAHMPPSKRRKCYTYSSDARCQ